MRDDVGPAAVAVLFTAVLDTASGHQHYAMLNLVVGPVLITHRRRKITHETAGGYKFAGKMERHQRVGGDTGLKVKQELTR